MASLIFPIAIFAVMWFFLIVPQRKKQKAQQELMASLAPGDEVVTTGGIYGGITEVSGNDIYLEIAQDVEIRVTRMAIATKVQDPAAAAAAAEKAKDEPKKYDFKNMLNRKSDAGDDAPSDAVDKIDENDSKKK